MTNALRTHAPELDITRMDFGANIAPDYVNTCIFQIAPERWIYISKSGDNHETIYDIYLDKADARTTNSEDIMISSWENLDLITAQCVVYDLWAKHGTIA